MFFDYFVDLDLGVLDLARDTTVCVWILSATYSNGLNVDLGYNRQPMKDKSDDGAHGDGMHLSWLEHRTITPLTQVRFPRAARDFLPRVNF